MLRTRVQTSIRMKATKRMANATGWREAIQYSMKSSSRNSKNIALLKMEMTSPWRCSACTISSALATAKKPGYAASIYGVSGRINYTAGVK